MNLIKLTTTDQKLKEYNDNIRRCIKDEPDYFSEADLVTSLDDLMSSYDSVINDPECQKIISDVKDDLTDFTGVYIKDQYEFVSDYANEKIIDNNPFYISEKFHICEYGVCDNASQAIKRFLKAEKDLGIDLGNCILCLRPIVKKNQPAEGGWCWHKWGPYIGVKDPQYEYIHDEDDSIKFVWCYHLYGVE